MNCNTEQKEMGGKDVLLKACVSFTGATTDESEDLTITAHGAKVGDIVGFEAVGNLTVVDVDTFYYIKEIVSSSVIKISASRTGAAIEFDGTNASLALKVFKGLGGIRSKSMSFTSDGIDITNEDSDQFKQMLDGAGIRSLEISGEGVYSNYDVAQMVEQRAFDNLLTCLMIVFPKTGRIYESCFKLTSFEISGDYDAESNLSISGTSSGTIRRELIPLS